MKIVLSVALVTAAVLIFSNVNAEDATKEAITSGPAVGEKIGAFHVVKCAGAEEDGVDTGEELCYRCRLGRRPVVTLFVRNIEDEKLITLLESLDKVVGENTEKKMASFINLLGEDSDALTESAKKIVKDSELKNIALVVPVDNENGPKSLEINEKADITVLVYRKGVVAANFAYEKDKLDDEAIKAIIESTDEILE